MSRTCGAARLMLALVWVAALPTSAAAQSAIAGTVRDMTLASLTVPLVAPGVEFLPRLNQLDLSFGKWFQLRQMRLQGQLDIFNAFNKNTERSDRSVNFATPTYLVPSSILQGRQVRLGVQMKW